MESVPFVKIAKKHVIMFCNADQQKKARKIFFNELNSGMKKIKTSPLLRRWVMIMVRQWAGGYDVSLPP